MPDVTNALLTEWAKIPTDTLQNLVEGCPSYYYTNSILMEFGKECPTSSYRCDGQVSTFFWQHSVAFKGIKCFVCLIRILSQPFSLERCVSHPTTLNSFVHILTAALCILS